MVRFTEQTRYDNAKYWPKWMLDLGARLEIENRGDGATSLEMVEYNMFRLKAHAEDITKAVA